MIFELEEESLLPVDYCPPTRRASRQTQATYQTVAFTEEKHGTVGVTIQQRATLKISLIDTILSVFKTLLLALVVVALLILAFTLLEFCLMQYHVISDPRAAFIW